MNHLHLIGSGVCYGKEKEPWNRNAMKYWKYPKIGFMFLAYAFFIWFINILLTLSTNLVSISQYQGFFVMIFNILMAGVYVAFIAMIWIFFVLAARDLKLVDLLTRGFNPR